jgi:hypothetical protein
MIGFNIDYSFQLIGQMTYVYRSIVYSVYRECAVLKENFFHQNLFFVLCFSYKLFYSQYLKRFYNYQ